MTPARWFLVLGLCAVFAGMWLVLVKGLDAPPPVTAAPDAGTVVPAPVPVPVAVIPAAPAAAPPPAYNFVPGTGSQPTTSQKLQVLPPGMPAAMRTAFETALDGGRPNVPWGFGADAGLRYQPTAAGIQAAVRGGIPDIKHCYEEWLKVQPGLQGRLTLHFTVGTNDAGEGAVTGVSLGDAGLGHFAMEGCVLQVFDDLQFDAPANGPLEVSYPLAFSPETDAG